MKKNKGITLIALVITIIVLLILAGVSIVTLTGNNGILTKANSAKRQTTEAQAKEEVQLAYNYVQGEAMLEGWDINKKAEELKKELQKQDENVEVLVVEKDLLVNYKGYLITIHENGTIEIEDKTLGDAPTGEVLVLTEGTNVDKVEIKVIAETTDGDIETIEPINGAKLKTDTSNKEKIFEVTQNGVYYFRIRGTNKRTAIIKSEEIDKIIKTSESLLKGIEEINTPGLHTVQVNGTIKSGAVKVEKYSLNVIYHKGDLELNGTNEVEGVVPTSNKEYLFGDENDTAKGSNYAQNTVVLKVDGNLKIDENVTLTAVNNEEEGLGGPKGLIVYCTGELTNNGKISMSQRGAKAEGKNVFLWKNSNDSYEYVPDLGGAGAGSAVCPVNSGYIIGNYRNRWNW